MQRAALLACPHTVVFHTCQKRCGVVRDPFGRRRQQAADSRMATTGFSEAQNAAHPALHTTPECVPGGPSVYRAARVCTGRPECISGVPGAVVPHRRRTYNPCMGACETSPFVALIPSAAGLEQHWECLRLYRSARSAGASAPRGARAH